MTRRSCDRRPIPPMKTALLTICVLSWTPACAPPSQSGLGSQPGPPQATVPPANQPLPAGFVMLPAGTRMMVRTLEAISSRTHKQGGRFKAKLESGMVVNGMVVVPPGNALYGTVMESRRGGAVRRPKLVVQITDALINGQLYPIATTQAGAEGGPQGTVAKVGAATIVGAAFGGGSGAGKGAAVGGAIALLTAKRQIKVPPNTLAEFSLSRDCPLPLVGTPTPAPPAPVAQQPVAQPAPQPVTAAPPPPPATSYQGRITLPVGTRIMVRTVDALSSGSHRAGTKFGTRLDAPITVGNQVVVPAGSVVYGRVKQAQRGGRLAKRAMLVVELSEINANGRLVPITTNQAGAQGDRQGTVAKVGAATIVGAAFGGGSGAGQGAAIGGAIALLTPGKQIRIPPKTLLEFALQQPAALP